ncbi:flagellar protein FlaG [Clostridium sp.]|uniref:flagellar protein FlaG n=1 Tax=Clostridium sp. TaxID=1506 RepID=UPI002630EE14|nr:flagellar protein FlaG [Clostridium sp.]
MELKIISQGEQANLNLRKTSETTKVSESKEVIKEVELKDKEYNKKDLDKALNKLNGFLKYENTVAEYSVHEVLGDIMIKIVNQDTKEIIMEFPPKKILDLVAKMCEIAGVLVDKKA